MLTDDGDDLDGELRRALVLDRLTWTDGGFPVVEDQVPSKQAETPDVDAPE